MRHEKDEIDFWCEDWAVERRKILGIILPTKLEPKERLGKLRSTLGSIQKDRVGAGEGGTRQTSNEPEVYTGLSLLIHRAWCSMPGARRLVMDAHYVWREIPVKIKAPVMLMSVRAYWDHLDGVKTYLTGYMRGNEVPPPRAVAQKHGFLK